MDYRKVALRVLFYSLGIAALAGILTMVLPNAGSVIGRLIGTAILTAVASSFLLIAIGLFEVNSTRIFGGGLGLLVLVIYLFTICAIWVEFILPVSSYQLEEKFALSALLFAGCGILILAGLLLVQIRKLKMAGYALSIIWAISLMTWLLVVWIFRQPAHDEFAENFAFPLQTLFPVICLAFVRRHLWYMAIAISISLASCIASQFAMFITQGRIEQNEPLFIFILISGGIAAMLGITNIIQFRKREYAVLWAERIAIFFIAITIIILCLSIWYNMYRIQLPDLLARLSVGMGILSSTSIIGLLIWQLLRSSVFAHYDGNGLKGSCPRCCTSLDIPSGKSRCPQCGLRMKLQIESTSCQQCGYDITKTPNAKTCSECGNPIFTASAVQ